MLVPNPDLVLMVLRVLISLFLMELVGFLSDGFVGILVK